MRDFARTAEPSGGKAADKRGSRGARALRFVVQKHEASHLHYDFRLELDGVLLSWAVPKGPSLSPKVRRLAIRTEDHPLEYADFEGVIPAGEYGAGTVALWDRGTWIPSQDARRGLEKGHLELELAGKKLRGRWHLVRSQREGRHEQWLLLKARDEAAPAKRSVARAASARSAREPAADLASLLRALDLGFALTNLDKVYYPEGPLTKGDVLAYVALMADRMLPHLAHRPLTIVRCPEGRTRQCFYQKNVMQGTPDAVDRIEVRTSEGQSTYMAVHDRAGLLALMQLGSLELHTWGCRSDDIEKPDLLVIDLDPDPSVAWSAVVEAAFDVRERLRALGLESFAKTTGGKGLHVTAPLQRRLGWEQLKAFTKALAERMAEDSPERYTANALKARRKGRIFIDYLRNGRGATFIAPYSPRAREHATVATPVEWSELHKTRFDPSELTILSVPTRIESQRADPWREMATLRQSIAAASWRALGIEKP